MQLSQERREQKRIGGVQQDVHEMKAKRVEPPRLNVQPEAGKSEWIKLGGDPRLKPDFIQALQGLKRCVANDIVIVVADKAAVHGWQIRHEHRRHKDGTQAD
jgi:hypothetical protein